VALARPRCEEQKEPGSAAACHGTTLVRFELEERPGVGVDRLSTGLDAHGSVEHDKERGLLHAVVAELLAGTERDQDCPLCAFLRMQDDWRPRAMGQLDLVQVPMAHDPALPAPGE
jgi:hypothetical protein